MPTLTWTANVCKLVALWAHFEGFVWLLFHMLLVGYRCGLVYRSFKADIEHGPVIRAL